MKEQLTPQDQTTSEKPASRYKNKWILFGIKLVCIFAASFLIFFWLTHSTFKENHWLSQISRITLNSIKTWESKLPPAIMEILYPNIKPSNQEELLDYKLTMVSKSLDQYFKNLLIKTQDQVANSTLLALIQHNNNYYNYYKTKRDMQKHLEQNRDVLEFSIYNTDSSRIVSLKHKNIPDYYLSKELLGKVTEKNNLLLKHKNSANLVLLSSVTHQNKPVFVISQTINPVFFTRILNYLEASKELFYLKDSEDFIIIDNYDAATYHKNKKLAHSSKDTATKTTAGDHNFIGLYETFVNLHEKNIKLDFDNVEYSLGMVVERNNIWGNIFSVFTLVFIIFISKVAIDGVFKFVSFTTYFGKNIVARNHMGLNFNPPRSKPQRPMPPSPPQSFHNQARNNTNLNLDSSSRASISIPEQRTPTNTNYPNNNTTATARNKQPVKKAFAPQPKRNPLPFFNNSNPAQQHTANHPKKAIVPNPIPPKEERIIATHLEEDLAPFNLPPPREPS
ncbi:hypothetical protein COTS27_00050 [Spirochaetota bacterium]|nr:hypothetical protein COTS27_00050 [Spirochaetota bacterium]